jgi:hypothetical protein
MIGDSFVSGAAGVCTGGRTDGARTDGADGASLAAWLEPGSLRKNNAAMSSTKATPAINPSLASFGMSSSQQRRIPSHYVPAARARATAGEGLEHNFPKRAVARSAASAWTALPSFLRCLCRIEVAKSFPNTDADFLLEVFD